MKTSPSVAVSPGFRVPRARLLGRLTIKAKLTLLAGVAIVSLLLVGFLTYRTVSMLDTTLDEQYNVVMKRISMLTTIRSNALLIRSTSYRVVATIDPQEIADAEKVIESYQQALQASFEEYKQQPPLQLSQINPEITETLRAVSAAKQEFFQAFPLWQNKLGPWLLIAKKAFTPEEVKNALHSFIQDVRPLDIESLNALQKVIKSNDKLGALSFAQSQKASRQANWILSSALVVVITLMFVLSIATIRGILRAIANVDTMASAIGRGDLTVSVQDDGWDEMSRMLRTLDGAREQLRGALREAIEASGHVAATSQSIAGTAQQISVGIQSQSNSTTNAAAAIEELTVNIDNVSHNVSLAAERAHEAGGLARTGNQTVGKASSEVSQVNETVARSASDIEALADQARQIGSVANVIRDVADQTNLLALNAAIEAARAGEQGRGFAVVADEVRKLAERTTASAQEISSTITQIQTKVNQTVDGMRQMRTVVGSVVTTADEAANTIGQVENSAEVVLAAVNEIASSLGEQRTASNELAQRVEQVAQMGGENTASVENIAQASRELSSIAQQLQHSMEKFKV